MKKYEFENFEFKIDLEYDTKLFWDIYRIYMAYNYSLDKGYWISPQYCACVAGEYGLFGFLEIDDKASEYDEKYFEYLFNKQMLLFKFEMEDRQIFDKLFKAKDLEEINSICNINELISREKELEFEGERISSAREMVEEDMNIYIKRLKKFVPKNILVKVKDIRVLALGAVTNEVYEEIAEFRNDLRKWLENPPGTNKKIELCGTHDLGYFHDEIFEACFQDKNLICTGTKSKIRFNNCKITYEQNDSVRNSKFKFEGYSYSSVARKEEEKIEFLLETTDVGNIVIECDNYDVTDLSNKDIL